MAPAMPILHEVAEISFSSLHLLVNLRIRTTDAYHKTFRCHHHDLVTLVTAV